MDKYEKMCSYETYVEFTKDALMGRFSKLFPNCGSTYSKKIFKNGLTIFFPLIIQVRENGGQDQGGSMEVVANGQALDMYFFKDFIYL